MPNTRPVNRSSKPTSYQKGLLLFPDDDGYIEFEWYHNGLTFSFYITPSEVVLYAVFYSPNDRFSGRFTFQDESRREMAKARAGEVSGAMHCEVKETRL